MTRNDLLELIIPQKEASITFSFKEGDNGVITDAKGNSEDIKKVIICVLLGNPTMLDIFTKAATLVTEIMGEGMDD